MQHQATLPGMFAPVQGVLAIEPAVPATEKQIAFAKSIGVKWVSLCPHPCLPTAPACLRGSTNISQSHQQVSSPITPRPNRCNLQNALRGSNGVRCHTNAFVTKH